MTLAQTVARVLLGAILLFTGIGHLTFARQEFVAQVPAWVPFSTDLVVLTSGVAELCLGGALVLLRSRRVVVPSERSRMASARDSASSMRMSSSGMYLSHHARLVPESACDCPISTK